jgi:polyamine oxidase
MLNSTVQIVRYDASGVEVQLESGRVLRAEYVIVTFSLGVLQHDEVVFEPRLPAWKVEAIESMTMVSIRRWFHLTDDRYPPFVGHLYQDLPPISAEVLV